MNENPYWKLAEKNLSELQYSIHYAFKEGGMSGQDVAESFGMSLGRVSGLNGAANARMGQVIESAEKEGYLFDGK